MITRVGVGGVGRDDVADRLRGRSRLELPLLQDYASLSPFSAACTSFCTTTRMLADQEMAVMGLGTYCGRDERPNSGRDDLAQADEKAQVSPG